MQRGFWVKNDMDWNACNPITKSPLVRNRIQEVLLLQPRQNARRNAPAKNESTGGEYFECHIAHHTPRMRTKRSRVANIAETFALDQH